MDVHSQDNQRAIQIKVVIVESGLRKTGDNQFCIVTNLKNFDTVAELADQVAVPLRLKSAHLRLFLRGKLLKRRKTLLESHVHSGAIIDVEDFSRKGDSIDFYGFTSTVESCRAMLADVEKGLRAGFKPRLASQGTGGTYFLNNGLGKTVACFKPRSEEQNAPHNPKNNIGTLGSTAMERSIRSGEMSIRETAAYILDQAHFHDVPKTTSIEVRSQEWLSNFNYNQKFPTGQLPQKIGSLQEFVEADVDFAADNDPRCYSVREVHKIAILDIRLLNCDRNEENILTVREDKRFRLIPIDHGLTFPDSLEVGWCDWVWTNWPQAKQNFDPFTLKFIESINVDEDIERLQQELPLSLAALDNIRVSGKLLQIGARQGLTLFEISKIILRQDLKKPSELELLWAQAKELTAQYMRRMKTAEETSSGHMRMLTQAEEPEPDEQDDTFCFGMPKVFSRESGTASPMLRTQSCIDVNHQARTVTDDQRQGVVAMIQDMPHISSGLVGLDLHDDALSRHSTNVHLARSSSPKAMYINHPEPDENLSLTPAVPQVNSAPNLADLSEFGERSRAISFKSIFFHYVKKLIEIKCMKIWQSKVTDEKDVYDTDTPHGTFTGLRGLIAAPKYRSGKTRKADYGVLYDKMVSLDDADDDEVFIQKSYSDDDCIEDDDYEVDISD